MRPGRAGAWWLLAAGLLLAVPPVSARAADPKGHEGHQGHQGHGAATAAPDNGTRAPARRGLPTDEAAQRAWFTDLPLTTQNDETVRFYTDVLKDRVVLISFIFTNCMEICPLLMGNLVEVERLLGDRAGQVRFVAISVDPVDDTPEELRKYAEKWGTGPGWVYLTGKKENIDWVVYKLGQYTEDFEDHSMLFLLADIRNGRWKKIRGDASPAAVAGMLGDLLRGP